MSLELYIGFVLASCLILIIPGPTIILVVSQAITHGKKAVVPLSAGVVTGDFTAMTLSLLGLGSLLSVSAELFNALKWVGALYLIYLGIRLWISKPVQVEIQSAAEQGTSRSLFRSSFIVTALNPKSITFFIAFFPQFVSTTGSIGQLFLLGLTFLTLAGVNALVYGLFAGQFNQLLQNQSARRWLNRGGGSALIGAGIVTAGLKQG
ncbi:MAG: LysE family translocator [Desulfofustis sp.]|nr:LysE family translocator [Desulfofustis sp.]